MPLFDIRSIALPYGLQLQKCGRYVLLNREYKPLGFAARDWVHYQDYPVLLNVRVTPTFAAKLSYFGDHDNSNIWLYGDGCIPTSSRQDWQAYSDRLAMLSKLKHLSSEWSSVGEIESLCRSNLSDAARFKVAHTKLHPKTADTPDITIQTLYPIDT